MDPMIGDLNSETLGRKAIRSNATPAIDPRRAACGKNRLIQTLENERIILISPERTIVAVPTRQAANSASLVAKLTGTTMPSVYPKRDTVSIPIGIVVMSLLLVFFISL